MKILIAWLAPFVGIEGGMERGFANFANEMWNRGHDVTLLYCANHEGKIYYPVCDSVRMVNLMKYISNGNFNGGAGKENLCGLRLKENSCALPIVEQWKYLISRESLKMLY